MGSGAGQVTQTDLHRSDGSYQNASSIHRPSYGSGSGCGRCLRHRSPGHGTGKNYHPRRTGSLRMDSTTWLKLL
jgi:hypothetical protein